MIKRFMTILSVLLLGSATSWAADASPLHWTNVGGSGADMALVGEVQGEYESNTYRYSEDDIQTYDNGLQRTTKFANVESVGDFSQQYVVGGYLSKEFAENRPTVIEHRSKFNIFSDNDAKDFEQYTFEVRQNISRYHDIFKFRYVYVPEFYVRNLFDEDLGVHRKAEFEKHSYTWSYWKQFNKKLRLRALYNLDKKDYVDNFNERDNLTHSFNIALILPELLPSLKVVPYYEYSTSNADASDGDPAVDDDISYDQNTFGVRLSYAIQPNLRFDPFYEYSDKEFTTSQSVANDPLHAGREDDVFSVGASVEYDLTKNILLFVKYEYVESNPTTSLNPSLTTRDDVLGYKNHSTSFGLELNF